MFKVQGRLVLLKRGMICDSDKTRWQLHGQNYETPSWFFLIQTIKKSTMSRLLLWRRRCFFSRSGPLRLQKVGERTKFYTGSTLLRTIEIFCSLFVDIIQNSVVKR